MSRSLLDEEETAGGRERGDGERGHQRETSRPVECPPGGTTFGPPRMTCALGARRRYPRPRPDGSERPAANSPLHRLSHAEVEGSRWSSGHRAGIRQVSCPGKSAPKSGQKDGDSGRPSTGTPSAGTRKEGSDLSMGTDNLTCDEMPPASPKIVTHETPHRARRPRGPGGSERRGHPRDPEQESESPPRQDHAHSRRHRPAPRNRLLHEHDHGQCQHPAEMDPADGEHHEHQSPATPHAVHPVKDADPDRPERSRAATPVLDHEADRRAALAEARVLERRELEKARSEKKGARQALRPRREPRRPRDNPMEARVREERRPPKSAHIAR